MAQVRLGHQLKIPSGDLNPVVQRIVNRIDRLHTVPDLGPIAIRFTDGASFGAYIPDSDNGPRHIDLSRRGPHPHLTLAHEIGHYLDHSIGGFDVYSSTEPASDLSDVVQVAQQTAAVTALRATLRYPDLTFTERWQVEYWLHPVEVWARAYAQYVASGSGDDLITRELELSARLTGRRTERFVQWQHDDYLPIADAIDRSFRRMGWVR